MQKTITVTQTLTETKEVEITLPYYAKGDNGRKYYAIFSDTEMFEVYMPENSTVTWIDTQFSGIDQIYRAVEITEAEFGAVCTLAQARMRDAFSTIAMLRMDSLESANESEVHEDFVNSEQEEKVTARHDEDPRDSTLIGEDDSWVHDIDMGAK